MYSFIFDVDGTLIDSYDGITSAVEVVLKKHDCSIDDAREFILKESVYDLLGSVSNIINVPLDVLYNEYKEERLKTQYEYKLMDNMVDMIKYLKSKHYNLFIYTHKGNAINKILSDNNISEYFIEVISSDSVDFRRKPDPYNINYLVDKYILDKNYTYYVGDRKIDVLCAKNANIKSIILGNQYSADIVINNFSEMKQLF